MPGATRSIPAPPAVRYSEAVVVLADPDCLAISAFWSVMAYISAAQRIGGDLTPLEPQSRFGDKPVKLYVICPQNGTAVLKGLIAGCLFPVVTAEGGQGRLSLSLSEARMTANLQSDLRMSKPPNHVTT